ncbi:hypothetical protein [Paenarthrobacter sp. C1]|uniref:hypothetical protein n=1 Tax=Paenarthrobacter sp. C1 TaxID=3400220 RepID=UPI003BF518F1
MAHLHAKPQSFTDWFRNNPGHAVRALPLTFAVFSIIMGIAILLPGGAAGSFTTASVAALIAGALHVGWRYLRATSLATRPVSEASEGRRGITLVDIMVWLSVTPILMIPVVVWVVSTAQHTAR